MVTEPKSIGEWLDEQCKREGLSLRQAADRTRLSHATIRDIRNNGHASAESIRKLAQTFGGENHESMALEDKLLILAGYRTPREVGKELSQPLAKLMDLVSGFDEGQLKLMARFAEFLGEMERDKR